MRLSVIIPVSERFDNAIELYREYRSALDLIDPEARFTYVIDGDFPSVADDLAKLQEAGESIEIIQLTRRFGEAVALTAGRDAADSDMLLCLPSYRQIDPIEISKIADAMDENTDMVIAKRVANDRNGTGGLQRKVFNSLVNWLTKTENSDLGCSVRLIRKDVLNDIRLYGDQHRFIPLLATGAGFRIKEVGVLETQNYSGPKYHGLGIYLRRILDVLTVFFLVKFTKKPLRFFGLIGSFTSILGVFVVSYVVAERLFLQKELADRPALLLGALSLVLGVQLFAIGLLGELVIFSQSGDEKEYRVSELVNIEDDELS